jgi:hypothetical protein
MAETIKFNKSNFLPQKAGYEFVEVEVKNDAAATMRATDPIPLGKSYRGVRLVSAAVSSDAATYSDQRASASIVDMATVKVFYNAPANSTVIATFECEV